MGRDCRGSPATCLFVLWGPRRMTLSRCDRRLTSDFIDYIIVDPVVVPSDQQPFFSERLVQLPCSYQVNDRRREVARTRASREDWGLPTEGLVLCSFSNSYKMSPAFFDIWMRLLRSVPGSVLWLLEAILGATGTPTCFSTRRPARLMERPEQRSAGPLPRRAFGLPSAGWL
jgi:Glycosyl transferase family 41